MFLFLNCVINLMNPFNSVRTVHFFNFTLASKQSTNWMKNFDAELVVECRWTEEKSSNKNREKQKFGLETKWKHTQCKIIASADLMSVSKTENQNWNFKITYYSIFELDSPFAVYHNDYSFYPFRVQPLCSFSLRAFAQLWPCALSRAVISSRLKHM